MNICEPNTHVKKQSMSTTWTFPVCPSLLHRPSEYFLIPFLFCIVFNTNVCIPKHSFILLVFDVMWYMFFCSLGCSLSLIVKEPSNTTYLLCFILALF